MHVTRTLSTLRLPGGLPSVRAMRVMLVLALATACSTPSRRGPGGNGGGADGSNGFPDGNNGCADGTELVYTIDEFNNQLAQFDPSTKMFKTLGALQCPASFGATPFSMSVGRDGTAWVLYTSGELFQVPISTLACTKSAWASQMGLTVFGMGFSTDTVGGSTEHLYVGGGASQMQASYSLAQIDITTMTATIVGSEPALPEMTGTGNAELWGFMPTATDAKVVQFDKTNGSIIKS